MKPPPVAPPLRPNTGPREGSRRAPHARLPNLFNPSTNPIDTVVFPSPYFVGDVAVTRISFFLSLGILGSILALYFP